MGMSTRWVTALGAAGVLAGAGTALVSVPAPATVPGSAPGVTTVSRMASTQVAAQVHQLATESAALQRAIVAARAQLTQLAKQKAGQLASEQASLDAQSQQLSAEQSQLVGESQQLSAEQSQLRQEAAALAAASASPPPVHATTGASGGTGGGGDGGGGDGGGNGSGDH